LAGGRTVDFDQLIIATGAWSARLGKTLGDRVLLESERGYNITIPNSGVSLTREMIFAERKFVATPMDMGLRIGGAAEFAGLETTPNYARSDALAKLARFYLPNLKADEGTRWMGHRPTTPDSLPVIGRSPHRDDVIHAYGS
jgi:D-amino-acid dehydrogenase